MDIYHERFSLTKDGYCSQGRTRVSQKKCQNCQRRSGQLYIFSPLTSRTAEWFATPAGLDAVQVYSPRCPGPTDSITRILALSPNIAVRTPIACEDTSSP